MVPPKSTDKGSDREGVVWVGAGTLSPSSESCSIAQERQFWPEVSAVLLHDMHVTHL
jgi:hypothetical protein